VDASRAQTVKARVARGGLMEAGSLGDHADNYTEDRFFCGIAQKDAAKRKRAAVSAIAR
jgi:hypothetical protein